MRDELEDDDGLTPDQIDRLLAWLDDRRGDAYGPTAEVVHVTATDELGEPLL